MTLLTNASKVLEKCILDQLIPIVCPNLLYEQFGLREKRSAIMQLLLSLIQIYEGREKKIATHVAYLDLREAFDRMDINQLLQKLHDMGVRGYLLRILSCYLNNRTQHVAIDGGRSISLRVNNGVPQGSLLGPVLFPLYIDKVPSLLMPFRVCPSYWRTI